MPTPAATSPAATAAPWAQATAPSALQRVSLEALPADSTGCEHEPIGNRQPGNAGDPVPYTLRGDNMMTIVLLGSFVLFTLSVASGRSHIQRYLKSFFRVPHAEPPLSETSGELRFQLFLVLLDCLLLGITTYLFITERLVGTVPTGNGFLHVALLFVLYAAYFAVKWGVLQTVVNLTLFDGRANQQWMDAQLIITSMQGVLLFPLIMLQVYFDLSAGNALFYAGFVLILTKMLSIYKCWLIFFRRNGGFFQTFLYFCALEIAPMLALAGALAEIADVMKTIF